MYFTRVGLALLTNIILGWKSLSGANTLAYYEHSYISAGSSTEREPERGLGRVFNSKLVRYAMLHITDIQIVL